MCSGVGLAWWHVHLEVLVVGDHRVPSFSTVFPCCLGLQRVGWVSAVAPWGPASEAGRGHPHLCLGRPHTRRPTCFSTGPGRGSSSSPTFSRRQGLPKRMAFSMLRRKSRSLSLNTSSPLSFSWGHGVGGAGEGSVWAESWPEAQLLPMQLLRPAGWGGGGVGSPCS